MSSIDFLLLLKSETTTGQRDFNGRTAAGAGEDSGGEKTTKLTKFYDRYNFLVFKQLSSLKNFKNSKKNT